VQVVRPEDTGALSVPSLDPLQQAVDMCCTLHCFTLHYTALHCIALLQPVVREGDKCNRLFIIDQGLLSSKGRLLGCGAIVGEQHFLLDKGRWSHSANTVTYTRLLSLDKDTFDE